MLKPVVTQILQSSKIANERGLDPYLGNRQYQRDHSEISTDLPVSMKIQAKLGGVTHAVNSPLLDSTTMMVGADVSRMPAKSVPLLMFIRYPTPLEEAPLPPSRRSLSLSPPLMVRTISLNIVFDCRRVESE